MKLGMRSRHKINLVKLISCISIRNQTNLIDVFEIIAKSRYTERNFSQRVVSHDTLSNILRLTILAPSSFNLQPYKIIIGWTIYIKTNYLGCLLLLIYNWDVSKCT